jgi:hypothetical protein
LIDPAIGLMPGHIFNNHPLTEMNREAKNAKWTKMAKGLAFLHSFDLFAFFVSILPFASRLGS